MAAVVAPPPSRGRPQSESNTTPEDSPNRFTAVNGRETNGFHGHKNSYDSTRPQSQHAQRGNPRSGFDRDREESSPSLSQSQDSSESGTHKRKRSPTSETNGYSPVSRYDISPPKRLEQPQHLADRALHALGNAERTTPPQYPQSSNGGHHHDAAHTWNGHPPVQQANYAQNGNRPDTSDSNLAEALQRATQDNQPQPSWGSNNGGPDDDERHGSYSQENTPHASNTGGPKRKRNFSNRTKTGCVTCRRRKKKCDESHPKCNNCLRGQFECEGYSNQRDSVWKPTTVKPPVPLQAKEGYSDSPHAPYKKENNPSESRTAPQPEGGQMRPITIDDGENGQPQFMSSPQSAEPRSRPSYSGQAWPPQGHNPYNSEHLPPMADSYSRPDSSKADYAQPSQRREHARPAPTQGPPPPPPSAPNPQIGQWQGPPPSDYRQAYQQAPPPPRAETSSQPPSRMSTGSYQAGAKMFTAEEVEKSKMKRHTWFNYLDPLLENERQRCEEALDRYNNACKRRNDPDISYREKLLAKVFDPSVDTLHHPIVPCKDKGVLGPRVKIEAPFTCTYGYNITVRDDAFIGKNCTIDDSAAVDIGQRSWIGPNVTIMTTDVSKDMVDRKGWEARWCAKPVFIGNEVVIGQGAVIYPGVHLAKGCTVEPFAIVKHSLAENMTQCAIVAPRF